MFEKISKFIFGTEESRRENKEKSLNELSSFFEKWSLSCNKCNKLSIPILGTSNRYKCVGCGRQFTGSNHYISEKINNRGVVDVAFVKKHKEEIFNKLNK